MPKQAQTSSTAMQPTYPRCLRLVTCALVVWAIREGRQAASSVDEYLMGASDLPR